MPPPSGTLAGPLVDAQGGNRHTGKPGIHRVRFLNTSGRTASGSSSATRHYEIINYNILIFKIF